MRIGKLHTPVSSYEVELLQKENLSSAGLSSSTGMVNAQYAQPRPPVSSRPRRPVSSRQGVNEVRGVSAVFNSKLKKSDLAAGDILILIDQPDNTTCTHQLIKIGQSLPSLSFLRNNAGDPALVHAVMWSKRRNNVGRMTVNGPGESEIVEMRGGTQLSSSSGPIRQGMYKVYSPKDKNLGDWAAQIGQIWSAEEKIRYSKPKSVLSILRNSNFNGGAKRASEKYAGQAFENKPRIRGSFCSHFILAAYQAAAANIRIPFSGALRVDAEATSVRTMEHFLKEDKQAFEFKGYLKIEPADLLY
ncbi:hypothetical protein VB151_14820 [Xanthomonas fragariae]|nr:hypothetical protein [Xanthomonas fragariae]MBL9196699.1 hypothetical protein [Xanthomonas fragariae]MBL9221408.1 hypothetical protein [Xanthomonas fragariae]MDM7555629.1 hypothetical protein [Xanthomonas fragariae]MDM7558734.1 hypothetical protein [Xanthomonas fragariae]MDM7573349.1 hypothetical protein [Xanthomonas fragariae]